MYEELVKERENLSLAGFPATLNNSNIICGPVDMSNFHRVSFTILVGAVTAGAAVQGILQQSANLNMNVVTNVAGAITTNMTVANQQATVEAGAMQLSNRYVQLLLQETGVKNATCSVSGGGSCPRNHPQNKDDASVNQRVVSTN
jgi:hypothetical protein